MTISPGVAGVLDEIIIHDTVLRRCSVSFLLSSALSGLRPPQSLFLAGVCLVRLRASPELEAGAGARKSRGKPAKPPAGSQSQLTTRTTARHGHHRPPSADPENATDAPATACREKGHPLCFAASAGRACAANEKEQPALSETEPALWVVASVAAGREVCPSHGFVEMSQDGANVCSDDKHDCDRCQSPPGHGAGHPFHASSWTRRFRFQGRAVIAC
jgi:hypothetical protein